MTATFRKLEPEAIVATIDRLSRAIQERFPGSGLGAVSRELLEVARETQVKADESVQPLSLLRVVFGVLIGVLVLGLVVVPFAATAPRAFALPELVQVTEAFMNIVVLAGGAVFFLATAERRLRRRRVLFGLNELRALAHVIDMHQLAKDPQRVIEPGFVMTGPELSHYLDYCSEMFSLIGKLAAVYAARLEDPEIIAAVNEVEALTTGLSRKVWQKIMVLQSGLVSEARK